MTPGPEGAAEPLWPGPRPFIVAHRGAPRHAPGNTLASLEAALGHGADALEVDVRATRDGTLVLHHDRRLDGSRLDRIGLDEARRIARAKGFELATLRAVLERFPDVPLDVELKETGLAEDALSLLLDHRSPGTFLITSFRRGPLSWIGSASVDVATGWLLSPARAIRLLYRRRRARRLTRGADEAGVDALVAHQSFLRLGLTSALRASRRPVLVWTVNRDRRLRKLIGHPFIDGMITDRTGRAVHLRRVQTAPATVEAPPELQVAPR